jgi:DNA repair protein RadC
MVCRETATIKIQTPSDVSTLCKDIIQLAQESIHVLSLSSKNKLLNRTMVTLGLADSSLVHPREVFKTAIIDNASSIVLVHNHPSGDPSPSSEDIRVTRQIIEAGKIIGITLVDHVIVGRNGNSDPQHFSIRESGLVAFA